MIPEKIDFLAQAIPMSALTESSNIRLVIPYVVHDRFWLKVVANVACHSDVEHDFNVYAASEAESFIFTDNGETTEWAIRDGNPLPREILFRVSEQDPSIIGFDLQLQNFIDDLSYVVHSIQQMTDSKSADRWRGVIKQRKLRSTPAFTGSGLRYV